MLVSMRNYGHLPPCRRLGYRIYATINRDPEINISNIRLSKQFKDVNAEVIRAQVTSNSFDNTIMAYKVAS